MQHIEQTEPVTSRHVPPYRAQCLPEQEVQEPGAPHGLLVGHTVQGPSRARCSRVHRTDAMALSHLHNTHPLLRIQIQCLPHRQMAIRHGGAALRELLVITKNTRQYELVITG